jgi:hypothetical protein
VSRTAILTGLSRREVRRQRQLLSKSHATLSGYVSKASVVLSAWHLDPDFLDKTGRPALLRLKGPGKTFAALLERAGGADVQPSTLLKELVNAGAVRTRTDGRLEAVKRDYIPHSMDEALIRLWGTVIADVASTYVQNLAPARKSAARRFERSAVNDQIPVSAVADFVKLLDQEGQAFLERMDKWLTAQQQKQLGGRGPESTVRLGVGMYHIQD